MGNTETLSSPDLGALGRAWANVAGYECDESVMRKAYMTIWAWPKGLLGTSVGMDGKRVVVEWGWDNGSLTVTLSKQEDSP